MKKYSKNVSKNSKNVRPAPPPRGMLRPTWEYSFIVKSCQIIYLASERKNLGHIPRSFFKKWQNVRFFGHFWAQLTPPLWNPRFFHGMSQHVKENLLFLCKISVFRVLFGLQTTVWKIIFRHRSIRRIQNHGHATHQSRDIDGNVSKKI